MAIFRITWRAIKDLFEELFTLMFANLIWSIMVLPLLLFGAWLLGLGSVAGALFIFGAVLLMGVANTGMHTLTDRIADGRAVKIGIFLDGVRAHWRTALRAYVLWGAGLGLILVSLAFYSQIEGFIGIMLTALFLYILVIWFTLHVYLGPLILLQSKPGLKLTFRNAMVLTFSRPIFNLIMLVIMAVFVFLSFWLPPLALLLTWAFFSAIGWRAAMDSVAEQQARREAQLQKQQGATTEEPDDAEGLERRRRGQIRPK